MACSQRDPVRISDFIIVEGGILRIRQTNETVLETEYLEYGAGGLVAWWVVLMLEYNV